VDDNFLELASYGMEFDYKKARKELNRLGLYHIRINLIHDDIIAVGANKDEYETVVRVVSESMIKVRRR
jgi:hypothetical protein